MDDFIYFLLPDDQQKQQRRKKIQDNRMRKLGVPVSSSPEECTTIDENMTKVKQEEVPKTHVIAGEADTKKLVGLSEKSVEIVQNIMLAFKESFDCGLDEKSQPMSHPGNNADFLKMADSSVRRCINMAKKLSTFRKLSQPDQIILIKGAVLEVLILRSVKMFDSRSLQWKLTLKNSEHAVSADALQYGDPSTSEFFGKYLKFADNFNRAIKYDNIVLMIIIVMTVMSPDRQGVLDKILINEFQETYASVLQEYIRVNYPNDHEMLGKVLHTLAEIRELDESHVNLMMQVQVTDLEPLIIEIFDLVS